MKKKVNRNTSKRIIDPHHRPEWRDILGNFKSTPRAKFELWSAKRRQKKKRTKLFRVADVFHVFSSVVQHMDFVDLVEVLAFSHWKSATLVTFLYERSRLRLNICWASHFSHVSAYGYVSLTIKEDTPNVWYDYIVWKFWLFVNSKSTPVRLSS